MRINIDNQVKRFVNGTKNVCVYFDKNLKFTDRVTKVIK